MIGRKLMASFRLSPHSTALLYGFFFWQLVHPQKAQANPYLERLSHQQAELKARRKTPAGILPLLELWPLNSRVPRSALAQLIELARHPGSHPLVQSYGLYLAARLSKQEGKLDEERRLLQQAGFIAPWLFCGPFENQSGRGHEEALPPEGDLATWPELGKIYQGKEQTAKWRAMPLPLQSGYLGLGSLLEPRRDVTVYLQTFIYARRKVRAALRLGIGASYKLFLDGHQIAAKKITRPVHLDQDAVGLWLRSGWNRLVLKVSFKEEPPRLSVRLSDPAGGPLAGWHATDEIPQEPEQKLPPLPVNFKVMDPGRWLGVEEEPARPLKAAQLRDRARYLAHIAPWDHSARKAEEVTKAWVDREPGVEGYLLLARVSQEANKARQALEHALTLSPRDPWVLYRLAELRQREGLVLQAISFLRQTLLAAPDFYPAELRLIEIFRAAGLKEWAKQRLEKLGLQHPAVGEILLRRAELALIEHDYARGRALYEKYLTEYQDDAAARKSFADLLYLQGEGEAAVAQLQQLYRFHPELLHVLLEQARLLEGLGQLSAAQQAFQQLLAVQPRSWRALELSGNLYHRQKQDAAAWAAWRQALKIRPQHTTLREYLAFLAPQRGQGQAERFHQSTAPLIAAAQKRGPQKTPARVLLNLNAVEVHRNGLSRRLHQRLVKVETDAGAKQLTDYVIQFSPDRQVLEVKVARVHRSDGKITESAAQREVPLNEPWARLWYDLRAKVLSFPGLQPGDIIEIEYLVEDNAADNMLADYFGDLVFLQEEFVVERFEYVLITPRQRQFFFNQPKHTSIQQEQKVEGERRIYHWRAQNVAAVDGEPNMPGWSEVAEYLHVSTYRKWEEVARWYWGLVEGQLKGSTSLGTIAGQITADAATELDKIKAIYAYVVSRTRYVGLEFGIHGYKPYPVEQVLDRKFGDCKDKASLLVALLREVGVEATLVLVRTRQRGDLARSPASLAPFDHAIAYLPRHQLYLDGTAELSGSTALPAADQGVMALHINQGQGGLLRTPTRPAAENLTQSQSRWLLAADGSARLEESLLVTGQAAAQWRRRYQVADHRRESYEKQLNQSLGGAKVLKLHFKGLSDLELPIRLQAQVQVAGLARRVDPHRMVLPLFGREWNLTRNLARLSRRKHPLILEYPWVHRQESEIRPPAKWQIEAVPSAKRIDSPFGHFSLTIQRQGTRLVAQGEFVLTRWRIEPAEYARFRDFLLRVDQLAQQKATFKEQGHE